MEYPWASGAMACAGDGRELPSGFNDSQRSLLWLRMNKSEYSCSYLKPSTDHDIATALLELGSYCSLATWPLLKFTFSIKIYKNLCNTVYAKDSMS